MLRTTFWAFVLASPAGFSADQPLPQDADAVHLGVASCASSTCHGAVQPFRDSNVMQNEFSIWQNEDPHNGAYKILLTDESKRIASNLGIGSAETADMCLDCHADNVPASRRGEKFQINDGVGCEACHGGAEGWLSSHASGTATHDDNLAAGLYPTENAVARAELCLSCHQGTKDQMITHRIMGAGHPRLQFELDNFTWMHPHFQVDEDYIERKGDLVGARDWAVGQAVAGRTALDVLLDDEAGWNGIFPELVLFDCHACHTTMANPDWRPRKSQGLGPGVVRYNDANLLMTRHVAGYADPSAASRLEQQLKDFHRATLRGRNETEVAARALKQTINDLLPSLQSASYDESALNTILSAMVREGEAGEYRDYAAAEQVALAVDTVIVAFENSGAISTERADQLRETANGLYDATREEEGYRSLRFVAALRDFNQALQ